MKITNNALINSSICTTALFLFSTTAYAASINLVDGQEHYLNNETYTDGGQGSGALRVFGQGTTAIGDSLTLLPTSYSSGGAYAGSGGKIVLTNSTVTSDNANDSFVYALWARWDNGNAQSTIEAAQTTVTTAGSSSHAAVAQSGGYIALRDSHLTTSGSGAAGIFSTGSGTYTGLPSLVDADNVTIETTGSLGFGAQLTDGGRLTFRQGEIKTQGQQGVGVMTYGAGSEARVIDSNITTSGEDSGGIAAQLNSAITMTGGKIEIQGGGATAIALAKTGSTIRLSAVDGLASRDAAVGLSVLTGGTMTASDGSRIRVTGVGSTALSVKNGGDITIRSSAVEALGQGSVGLSVKNDDMTTQAQLTLTDSTLRAEKAAFEIESGNAKLSLNNASVEAQSGIILDLEGKAPGTASAVIDSAASRLSGDIRGASLDLNMSSGSVWAGSAHGDSISGRSPNVVISDSRWNLTGSSGLDKLTLNNSTVDLSHAQSGSGYSTLSVAHLSGNGSFVLRTDIVGDGINNAGDRLVVTETSAGNHLLTITNRGSLATTGNEVLTVVETADGAASFTSTSQVELGGYLYDVRKNGNSWELYSSGAYIPPTDPTPEEKPKPPVTTTADAGGNYLNVGYLLNYAETQTLMQRMGDLRQSGERGNAWMRGFGGKFDAFASGKLSGFDMTYSGTQLGFDKRVSAETPLYIGTFMGLTRGSPDYRSGDGTVQSHHVGLYATYMADSGFYIDGIAKLSRLKNSFSVMDSQSNKVSGSGSSTGASASVEVGQRLSLSLPGNGFYIEPQAQFTYGHQTAAHINASNGLRIRLGSYESMIGRVGTLFGYETAVGNSKVDVYLKTGLVREFDGNTAYRLNGSREAHGFKGNWWNNGLGVSASINDAHALYVEVDSSTGNRFDQRQVNGGYRFSF